MVTDRRRHQEVVTDQRGVPRIDSAPNAVDQERGIEAAHGSRPPAEQSLRPLPVPSPSVREERADPLWVLGGHLLLYASEGEDRLPSSRASLTPKHFVRLYVQGHGLRGHSQPHRPERPTSHPSGLPRERASYDSRGWPFQVRTPGGSRSSPQSHPWASGRPLPSHERGHEVRGNYSGRHSEELHGLPGGA